MQIKDVEKLTGMVRANIRYYEKQGLLDQASRNEFNYREYTEEDVQKLQRINLLRTLGVSMGDIKEMKNDVLKMDQVILKQLSNLTDSVEKIIEKK